MREAIRDRHNRVLAYIHDDGDSMRVTDAHNRILGYVTSSGTFDVHRRRISFQREPGLLVALIHDGDFS